MVASARAAFARGDFATAQRDAETVLRMPSAPAVRVAALMVAADAAYRAGAYARAATYYEEIVGKYGDRPEAVRAAFALGWTDLRLGAPDSARRTWARFTDTYPAHERAPLALLLTAELAREAKDLTMSQRLLDQMLAKYAKTPYAGVARLTRATVALQRGREDEALRDLDVVVRTTGPWVVVARSRLEDALRPGGSEAGLELAPSTRAGEGAYVTVNGQDRLEPFVALMLGGSYRERTPYVLHGLVLVAAADRGWPDTTTAKLAGRLVEQFPPYAPGTVALDRVGSSAAAAGQWPVARRAYETLFSRVPSAVTPPARLAYAEALMRTGATAEARTRLDDIAGAGGSTAPGAIRLLMEMHDARGDRAAALAVMRRLVDASQGEAAAEAAYRLGERLRADGQHAAAAEWYFTAVYLGGERTRWARLSLLNAGRSLTSLGETREALAAYWRLVARRPDYDPTEDRETSGEAAYLAAEILQTAGLPEEAVKMFAMSAHLTAGSRAEPRALLGALKCFVALGDSASAERTFRRLSSASAVDPATVTEARKVLAARADANQGESALPKAVR